MAGRLNARLKARFWAKLKNWCHEAVVSGYQSMLSNPAEFKQWKEESISARLLHEMRKDGLLVSKNISVKREHYLGDEAILLGEKEASEADRIDFSFESTWQQKEYLTYFGESKNLSARDWRKATGKTVKAWNQRDYYLTTGIQGIITGKYKKVESFLIGYLVNGSAQQNLDNLNKHIQNRRPSEAIGQLEKQSPIRNYAFCYLSKNFTVQNQVDLLHIFLEFDN
ncbi:MAG: hypothetical protein AAF960_18890 [Bacteroidota bacterium]